MKKRLLALLLAMSIIPLLMACNKDNINDDNQLAQTKTDQTTKKSDKETSHSDITETKISKEQAKHIALKDAGFTEKEVTLLTVEQDIDDGVTEFEVEFTKDATEYNYTINADTGKIISKETEDVNDQTVILTLIKGAEQCFGPFIVQQFQPNAVVDWKFHILVFRYKILTVQRTIKISLAK